MPSALLAFLAATALQPPDPVIIDIRSPEQDDISGLADILIGALGLSGALLLAAVLVGVVLGGLIFWIRSRPPRDPG